MACEQERGEESGRKDTKDKKRRTVHYGDPDYYDLLPPDLEYLRDLPLADGAIDFDPPSYEVEVEEPSDQNPDEQQKPTLAKN